MKHTMVKYIPPLLGSALHQTGTALLTTLVKTSAETTTHNDNEDVVKTVFMEFHEDKLEHIPCLTFEEQKQAMAIITLGRQYFFTDTNQYGRQGTLLISTFFQSGHVVFCVNSDTGFVCQNLETPGDVPNMKQVTKNNSSVYLALLFSI
jgi:hypothetical protein